MFHPKVIFRHFAPLDTTVFKHDKILPAPSFDSLVDYYLDIGVVTKLQAPSFGELFSGSEVENTTVGNHC